MLDTRRVGGQVQRFGHLDASLARFPCIHLLFPAVKTVQIFDRLSEDPTLREAAVAMAEARLQREDAEAPDGNTIEYARNQIGEIAPFIGWSENDPFWAALKAGEGYVGPGLMKLVGLVLTAFAISLGAPFWFNTLKSLASLRPALAGKIAQEMGSSSETKKKPS